MALSANFGDDGRAATRRATERPTTSRAPIARNPIAQIQSLAMLLRESLDLPDAAQAIEHAIVSVLAAGHRTADIAGPGKHRRRHPGADRAHRGGHLARTGEVGGRVNAAPAEPRWCSSISNTTILDRPGLVPAASRLVARVATLLDGFRALSLPIVHVHTITRADGTDRMPHWREQCITACVEEHRVLRRPKRSRRRAGELVVTKQYYRGFVDPAVDPWLRARGVARIVVAGVYTHACVRETALDAYEGGFEVWVAADAVGSTEPAHAALTRAWLEPHAARFRTTPAILSELGLDATTGQADVTVHPVAVIGGRPLAAGDHERVQHHDPCLTERVLGEVPLSRAADVRVAAEAAAVAQAPGPRCLATANADALDAWADVLAARAEELTEHIVEEVGKPRGRGRRRSAARHCVTSAPSADLVRGDLGRTIAASRRTWSSAPAPVGVIGILMPWNNPLALPCGKIAPALGFGNAVVFKPAPEGTLHRARAARHRWPRPASPAGS